MAQYKNYSKTERKKKAVADPLPPVCVVISGVLVALILQKRYINIILVDNHKM